MSSLVDERVDDLLLDGNARELGRDGADALAEKAVGDGQDVRLVDDRHCWGSLVRK